jgi:uncharacterized protein YndB with AHSA1/START domain
LPQYAAERTLLASRGDTWSFLAEPHHLPDWWPGIGGVQPDRRGLAAGARWMVMRTNRPSLLRRSQSSGLLLVRIVEPLERLAFHLTVERMDAELRLHAAGPERTDVTLTVSAPWLVGLSRRFPQRALDRLHALLQTAAEA